eukprot:2732440-Prorocentrum_lima.AAC.1
MTSSLVGSEMCIRDSTSLDRHSWMILWLKSSVFSPDGCCCFLGGGGGSVSYTHLTLPTICSV